MSETPTTSIRTTRELNRKFAIRHLRGAATRFRDAAADLETAADRIEGERSVTSVTDAAGWAVDHAMWTIANAHLGSVVIAAAQADIPDEAPR